MTDNMRIIGSRGIVAHGVVATSVAQVLAELRTGARFAAACVAKTTVYSVAKNADRAGMIATFMLVPRDIAIELLRDHTSELEIVDTPAQHIVTIYQLRASASTGATS
jgi:hypothetical protein